MDERLLPLFRHVVDEYLATSEPVGSQTLVDRYRMEVSPATVRNWFAELDEAGLLTQPHTSGGRIPTEKGFKRYIELFVGPKALGKRDREALEAAAGSTEENGRSVKRVAKALAEISGQAVLVGLNQADTFYTGLSQLFGQAEFKNWQRVVSLSELLDHLDETLNEIRRERLDAPRILLGKECPFGPVCGSVIASHDAGLIVILGPLRMDYQHALSLLTTVVSLLNQS